MADGGPSAAAGVATGTPPLLTLAGADELRIELLANGSIFAIRAGDILIDQVLGSPLEGGPGGLWLRRRVGDAMAFVPLIGPASSSAFRWSTGGASWTGTWDGVEYRCTLRLASTRATWSWTIELANDGPDSATVDVVLAQDVGLAPEAAVRSSERYTSQYLDHLALEDDELGFVLATRQNQPQDGRFPWLVQACLDGAAGYLTDGQQLYEPAFRATGVPVALTRPDLPDERVQGEFALPTLQARPIALPAGGRGSITFVAAFVADHPAASGPADLAIARRAAAAARAMDPSPIDGPPVPRVAGLFDAPRLFPSQDLDESALAACFGTPSAWRHVERDGDALQSFFHGAGRHVVLRAKELAAERPTGDILRSGRDLLPTDDILAVTAWMGGVFGSHLVIGNTSYDKLLSVVRDPLDVRRSSGQRVFVRRGRGDELLGMPSAFEMGPLSARWIYQDDDSTIVVRLSTSLDDPVCRLDVEVVRGDPVSLVVTEDIVVGANEYDPLGEVAIDEGRARVRLRPHPDGFLAKHYPETAFWIAACDPGQVSAIGRDGLLRADGQDGDGTHVVIVTHPVSRFGLVLTGSVLDAQRAEALADAASGGLEAAPDADGAAAWRRDVARGATIGGGTGRTEVDTARLDELIGWYVHDGLIHATSPHGLEQSTGAAWAVRDVCQGPVELFLALDRPEPIRDILRVVYEHQFLQTGDWPQWFMYDRYRAVQAADSHADIIVWPIKALCDYIEATDDLAILDMPVAWTDHDTLAVTDRRDPIVVHTERQLDRLETDCIPGTALPMFAGGDWEDTLQPADPATAQRLVSTWTVELAYLTLERYKVVCARAGRTALVERLTTMLERIAADFRRHLLPDGVAAGLAHFGPDGVEYLLHPRDRRTGVAYRLLPMTHGMLSGLFTPDEARDHLAIIREHLAYPDGVHLMDRPMPYRGGTTTIFKRAESAAYFGREVGLQYVHAHLRHVEAMCLLGEAEEAFDGLLRVCPIDLRRDVPNALPRQANAYFSSSDADVPDRLVASRDIERIKAGEIGVKGGWRVYSSGPGLFLDQLVRHILGLRRRFDARVFDPVLPARADGLTFERDEDGRLVRYRFTVGAGGSTPREIRVNGRVLASRRATDSPYRPGGLVVAADTFRAALHRDRNEVEVIA